MYMHHACLHQEVKCSLLERKIDLVIKIQLLVAHRRYYLWYPIHGEHILLYIKHSHEQACLHQEVRCSLLERKIDSIIIIQLLVAHRRQDLWYTYANQENIIYPSDSKLPFVPSRMYICGNRTQRATNIACNIFRQTTLLLHTFSRTTKEAVQQNNSDPTIPFYRIKGSSL